MAMANPDADWIYREALAAFQQGRIEEGVALARKGIAGHPGEARFQTTNGGVILGYQAADPAGIHKKIVEWLKN